MRIIHAQTHFRGGLTEFIRGPLTTLAARQGITIPPLTVVADEPPLTAEVNHGRWLVFCPDCNGAEYAWEDDLMMCGNCFNRVVGVKWRRTQFPAQRAQIEAVLLKRKSPETQHWRLHESVADLRRENREHSLPEGV